MITLPKTPFDPLQIPVDSDDVLLRNILSKRQTLSSSSNTTMFISNLESYLEYIYLQVQTHGNVSTYTDVIPKGESLLLSQQVPWKLNSIKKNGDCDSRWMLSHEIKIVLLNISLGYNTRASEIIQTVLSDNDQASDSENQKRWLSAFKLFKKALEYVNFLSIDEGTLNTSQFLETSTSFITVVQSLIQCSIQMTFLSKAIWTLESVEFDIGSNDSLNYSTLSRISIFVRDELKRMITILRSSSASVDNWIEFLENVSRFNTAYIGTLLSIENYKQNKLGISLGFLNISIMNIATKKTNDEYNEGTNDDSKMKKHLSSFKSKLSSKKVQNLIKPKKLKINKSLLENLQNSTLQESSKHLFQLIDLLNLKYNLENNNLNFETIVDSSVLLQSHLPTGRPVPLSDGSKTWVPQGIIHHDSNEYQGQGQYY